MSSRAAGAARRALARPTERQGLEELHDLRDRVARLEQENVELRRHGMRTAEVLDLVSELLLPLSQQDPEQAREAVERFRRGL